MGLHSSEKTTNLEAAAVGQLNIIDLTQVPALNALLRLKSLPAFLQRALDPSQFA